MARSTMTPGRRRATDTHGRGVGDARSALPAVERLAEAMASLPGDNPAFATHGHLLRIRFA
jgi:hypothetical protein